VFLVVRTSGYFFYGLTVHYCTFSRFWQGMAERTARQYIIVLFRVFGKEWPNGRPEVEPNFPPQRFLTELDLTARKFRQKGRE
jgi:hypothetical protein